MFFPPLIFLAMLVFFFLALILLPFLWVGVIGEAFIRLGISPNAMFWLLMATLLGSLVNIPLTTIDSQEIVEGETISYFGMRVRLPRVGVPRRTVLAVNVGGALVPLGLCLYLLAKMDFTLGLPLMLALVTLVMYYLARPVKGLGIAVPGLVPPLVAVLAAYLFCPPELRAPSAFIASTMGTLIGADLLHLRDISNMGAPVASIGGAGTFDAIFLSGIIAVLLS